MAAGDYSFHDGEQEVEGEIKTGDDSFTRARLAILTNHAVGIADLISVALRDAATHLEALRFVAERYHAGDHTAVMAGLAPYTIGSEEDRLIGPAVLDAPRSALASMIEEGTPEEVRVGLVCDAAIEGYRQAAAAAEVGSGDERVMATARMNAVIDLRAALVRS